MASPGKPETQPTPILGGSAVDPTTDFSLSHSTGSIGDPNSGGGNLAQGDQGMTQAQQGLLSNQISRANGNDSDSLMSGVRTAATGLLKDTPTGLDEGFGDALKEANKNAVGQTANSIDAYTRATQPLRQAQYEQESAANLAKVSQLDMNDYMLYNQQQLQQMQLQQMQEANQMAFVGQVVGAVGSFVGMAAKAAG